MDYINTQYVVVQLIYLWGMLFLNIGMIYFIILFFLWITDLW